MCRRIILSNGEIFFGRFVLGKMTGLGEYQRPDISKYKGEFSEGIPHGSGKEQLKDGSLFDGVYFSGMRKKGKIIWKLEIGMKNSLKKTSLMDIKI